MKWQTAVVVVVVVVVSISDMVIQEFKDILNIDSLRTLRTMKYVYIYIYAYMHMYIYIYIYIYT